MYQKNKRVKEILKIDKSLGIKGLKEKITKVFD